MIQRSYIIIIAFILLFFVVGKLTSLGSITSACLISLHYFGSINFTTLLCYNIFLLPSSRYVELSEDIVFNFLVCSKASAAS